MVWWVPLAMAAAGALSANEKQKTAQKQYDKDSKYNKESARMKYIMDFGQRKTQAPGSEANAILGGAMGGFASAQGMGLTGGGGEESFQAAPQGGPLDNGQSMPAQGPIQNYDPNAFDPWAMAANAPPPTGQNFMPGQSGAQATQLTAGVDPRLILAQQQQQQQMAQQQNLQGNPWALLG